MSVTKDKDGFPVLDHDFDYEDVGETAPVEVVVPSAVEPEPEGDREYGKVHPWLKRPWTPPPLPIERLRPRGGHYGMLAEKAGAMVSGDTHRLKQLETLDKLAQRRADEWAARNKK